MSEQKISKHNALNSGTIELFKIEGLFYVKSAVNGLVKFSDAVSKSKAECFIFDAVYYGVLEF